MCQLHSPKVTYRNPLIPLPIIETPFSRIALDIVGPLPKSSRGHRYLLVILDYANRFPEAIPLRSATSKAVARELVQLFSWVGIADEILTDQGSCFMSMLMKETCRQLKVKQLKTSIFHPQTDGLVERFNKTLKQMLRKVIDIDRRNWDQLLLLFIYFFCSRSPAELHRVLTLRATLWATTSWDVGPRQGKLGAAAITVSQHHRVCRTNERSNDQYLASCTRTQSVYLPSLATFSAAILLVDVQAVPVMFLNCLSVYYVPVIESHANLTTLFYLCF